MLEGALILIEVHLGEKEPRVQEAARFIGRVCCKGAVASQPHALVGRLGFLGFLIVSQTRSAWAPASSSRSVPPHSMIFNMRADLRYLYGVLRKELHP
jgi:hypothetical protein